VVPSISPSQVRVRILAEHTALRQRLDRLAEATAQAGASPSAPAAEVIAQARELYCALLDHLDFEDALLDETLRGIDAWGPIRAEQLALHHAEQRVQLRNLLERTRDMSPAELSELLQPVIEDLRADMLDEEQDILSPQLLRDDVIAIDGEVG
jgi:iron-sulfur cluster repair protein YtfE (RIC family)